MWSSIGLSLHRIFWSKAVMERERNGKGSGYVGIGDVGENPKLYGSV